MNQAETLQMNKLIGKKAQDASIRCNGDDVVFNDILFAEPLVMPLRFSAPAAENADLKNEISVDCCDSGREDVFPPRSESCLTRSGKTVL